MGMIVDSAICNTSNVDSIMIGQNCFTFMVESCSQGCNFNSADQVCKEEGAKLAEPQGGQGSVLAHAGEDLPFTWWTGATTLGAAPYSAREYYWDYDRKTEAS